VIEEEERLRAAARKRRRVDLLQGDMVPSLAAMMSAGIYQSYPAAPPVVIAERSVAIVLAILDHCEQLSDIARAELDAELRG